METYEEKYKDLVKRLNKAREEKGVYTFNSVLDAVAPELKIEESEDERIRKAIINLVDTEFGDRFPFDGFTREQMLAWLEKQVEQNPTEWSEEDEQLYNDLSDTYFYNDEDYPEETYKLMLKRVLDWMTKRAKSLRPQSQWKPSKEMLEALYRAIPENVMEISEDEMLLDKLYQGLKYGRVLNKK